jgi:hypothetical protein
MVSRRRSKNWDDPLRVFVVDLHSRGVGNKDCLTDQLCSEYRPSEVTLMEGGCDGTGQERAATVWRKRGGDDRSSDGRVFFDMRNSESIYNFLGGKNSMATYTRRPPADKN